MHRVDLLKENAPVMIGHARAINQAAPMARVLVVTSPCNTNCLVAMTHAHDVPKDHWFALNQHIRMRAIAMVAAKTGAPVTQVTRVTVWGNNSETAYVDLQNARVGNKPALQVISEPDWYSESLRAHHQRTLSRGCEDRWRHTRGVCCPGHHDDHTGHYHTHAVRTLDGSWCAF